MELQEHQFNKYKNIMCTYCSFSSASLATFTTLDACFFKHLLAHLTVTELRLGKQSAAQAMEVLYIFFVKPLFFLPLVTASSAQYSRHVRALVVVARRKEVCWSENER